MPFDVRHKISKVKDPDKYLTYLTRKSRSEIRDWLLQSGKQYDIVFNLHDNTPPPKMWKYEKSYIESLGAQMTEDGFVATPLNKHVEVTYWGISQKIADTIKNFRPKISPKVSFETDIYLYNNISEDPGVRYSNNEIALEYFPARIDKWSKQITKLPVTKGLNFFLKLLYDVRENYP